jgi:Beta-propeller repeat
LWSKAFGGGGNDEGLAVTTDATSHVYMTGTFDTKIDFGGGTLPDGSGLDAFLVKFEPSGGGHVLSKGFPAFGNQYANAIAVDGMDNIYLAGEFNTEIDMGGGKAVSAGLNDVFVTRLDSTGAHVYTNTYGDPEEQIGRAMTIDKNGDLVFAVALEGTVDVGGGPATYAGPATNSDLLVLKLKSLTGAHVWSRRFGATNDQDPRGIATDLDSNIFLVGEFGGTLNFGNGISITAASSDDAYIVKLQP